MERREPPACRAAKQKLLPGTSADTKHLVSIRLQMSPVCKEVVMVTK